MSFVNRLKLVAIAVPRAMASSDESDIDDTRAKAQSGGEVLLTPLADFAGFLFFIIFYSFRRFE